MSASDVLLRELVEADLPAVVTLNTAAVPAVPLTDAAEMAALLAQASLALVAEDGLGGVVGFLIAMDPGLAYDSENYRWFARHGDSFLYVDRVVLAEAARGRGIGRALYDAVFARAAQDGRTEVDCEVNLDPPNPGSLAFHARLGFERMGEQATKGGTVRVALLAAPVARRPDGGTVERALDLDDG